MNACTKSPPPFSSSTYISHTQVQVLLVAGVLLWTHSATTAFFLPPAFHRISVMAATRTASRSSGLGWGLIDEQLIKGAYPQFVDHNDIDPPLTEVPLWVSKQQMLHDVGLDTRQYTTWTSLCGSCSNKIRKQVIIYSLREGVVWPQKGCGHTEILRESGTLINLVLN